TSRSHPLSLHAALRISRFHLLGGYEPTSWLLVFAEADLTLGRTSRASPPPDPRAYALYGFGAGARLTVPVGDRVGLLLQPRVGRSEEHTSALQSRENLF